MIEEQDEYNRIRRLHPHESASTATTSPRSAQRAVSGHPAAVPPMRSYCSQVFR